MCFTVSSEVLSFNLCFVSVLLNKKLSILSFVFGHCCDDKEQYLTAGNKKNQDSFKYVYVYHTFISIIISGCHGLVVRCWTCNHEVTHERGFKPSYGMEEMSRSSLIHCFTPPRCNGYLALGNHSDGAGMSS